MKHPRSRPPSALLLGAALLAAACATEAGTQLDASAGAEPIAAHLELPPPAQGFQVQTLGVLIEPGDDLRLCEVLQLPGSANQLYHVARIEAAMTPHGNDLIVTAAPVDSETAAIMDRGARVPCTRAGEAFGEELKEVVSSRHLYLDQRFPIGTGKVFHGGQKIAVDYHYDNHEQDPIAAVVKLNFHTVDAATIERTAHTASFQNLTIYTPPQGRSSHLAECAVSQPVVVGQLMRRTQQRGTDFTVWLAGGERDGEMLWHSADPGDSEIDLAEPLLLMPGEGFRFECDYENPTDLELRFGVNTGDEMCTLNATYWTIDAAPRTAGEGCLLLDVDADGVARK